MKTSLRNVIQALYLFYIKILWYLNLQTGCQGAIAIDGEVLVFPLAKVFCGFLHLFQYLSVCQTLYKKIIFIHCDKMRYCEVLCHLNMAIYGI